MGNNVNYYRRDKTLEKFLKGTKEKGLSNTDVDLKYLISLGYDIRNKGTSKQLISPEKPYPWEVGQLLISDDKWFKIGREIIYFEEITSTNEFLMKNYESLESGTCVIANSQSKGKGRSGRAWFSPEGLNIYTSILLKLNNQKLTNLSSITLTTGIAVQRVLDNFGIQAELKWPNDIYSKEKKIAGILHENKLMGNGENITVVGIGINVNAGLNEFPPELKKTATSMKIEKGIFFNRAELTAKLYDELNYCYYIHINKGFEAFREEYENKLMLLGKKVDIINNGKTNASGKILGVDGNGALLIHSDIKGLLKVYTSDGIILR